METTEKCVKSAKGWLEKYQNDVTDVVLVSFLLRLSRFHTGVSIVDFEQMLTSSKDAEIKKNSLVNNWQEFF